MSAASTASGIGTHAAWGITPCRSLACPGKDGANVLVLGGAEIGHLLATLADDSAVTSLFVLYESPEMLARQLLLLAIALDPEWDVNERCEVFLEVFGNTMLREKTNTYLINQAKLLILLISQEPDSSVNSGGHQLPTMCQFDQLKYSDRDALEQALKFVISEQQFLIDELRDHRLRAYYAERYDVRKNLIDWDYLMNLRPVASIVHQIQYTEWRQTGLAFEVRENMYTRPNRTLASFRVAKTKSTGKSVNVRGFWGDILVSPYIVFGLEASESNLFKKSGDQHLHTAVDVSRAHLKELLQKISSIRMPSRLTLLRNREILLNHSRFKGSFSKILLPATCELHPTDSRLNTLMSPANCQILVESVNFIPTVTSKDRKAYNEKLQDIATTAGWKNVTERQNAASTDLIEFNNQ